MVGEEGTGALGRLKLVLKRGEDEPNEEAKNLSFKDSVLLLNGVLGGFEAKFEKIDLKIFSDRPFLGLLVINDI